MSTASRDRMLATAQANKPAELPLPTVPDFGGPASMERFSAVLAGIGGTVVWLDGLKTLGPKLQQLFPEACHTASPFFRGTVPVDAQTPTETLAGIDLVGLPGEIGVAENGAVWLPETNMLHRALPTITQHLVLVLDHRRIVATMHQAYAQLPGTGGYVNSWPTLPKRRTLSSRW